MSNLVELNISLWLVGVEENLLGRMLTDRDGGPPRTCPCLKVNSERVSQRSAHLGVLPNPTKDSVPIKHPCLFLSLLRETFLSRVLYLVIWHLEFTDQISLPFLLYPSHLFTFSLRPPLPCSPFLSPTPTRPACYFFVQGPVIKFDISTGIKYAVGEGEKGALLQSQGQL